MEGYNKQTLYFLLLVTFLFISAVILDAVSEDDQITGDASLKSIRKKIKKELQQAIGQAPKPAPTPQLPIQPQPTTSTIPITDVIITQENAHVVGGPACPQGFDSRGTLADCGGGKCNGNQRLCAKRSSSEQQISDIILTGEGAHTIGSACPQGFDSRGTLADCGGGKCNGNQRICTSRTNTQWQILDVLLTQENAHVVGGPACPSGYIVQGSLADCGAGRCFGNQKLCVKKEARPLQAVNPTPAGQSPTQQPITENVVITLSNKITTQDGSPIDINAVPLGKQFRVTFKTENQGIKEYRPIYTIQIINRNNEVVYTKSLALPPIKQGEFLEITEAIRYDDAYGKTLKLTHGEFYTLKISISQQQGETNFVDNEQTLKFRVLEPPPAVNMRVLSLVDKTFTIGNTPLSLQAINFDKPVIVNFIAENDGVPLFGPNYNIQILSETGTIVYQTQIINFDKPFTPGEKREISHEIDYEKYRVQPAKILAPLTAGNYKLKITLGKAYSSISETNVEDNQIIIPFTLIATTPKSTDLQLPTGTGKLQELGERPKAQQVGLAPINIPTVILPPEVGV